MYAVKLNINKAALQKTLWGDYFVNMKAQRVVKGAQVNILTWFFFFPLAYNFFCDPLFFLYSFYKLLLDTEFGRIIFLISLVYYQIIKLFQPSVGKNDFSVRN